jgi:hypothetical protein
MVIGSIAALLSAALYPLIFYLFGEVAGSFIQFEGVQLITNAIANNENLANLVNQSNKPINEIVSEVIRNQSKW